jgi:hypothetical protein
LGGSEATQTIAGIVVIKYSMRVFVPLLGLPQKWWESLPVDGQFHCFIPQTRILKIVTLIRVMTKNGI